MRNITYKYNIGDTVKFKGKFPSPSCGLAERAGTTTKITGLAKAYNNKPHYYIEGDTSAYPERCFECLISRG